MSWIFRVTAPQETERVREFLASVFAVETAAPSLDLESMEWRFHQPRPDWFGSRSYVLERDGEWVAHGCVWPMELEREGRNIRGCQIVDWAGSRRFPGSGLVLRRKIEELADVSFGVGGSEDSRKVMPRAGYRTVTELRRFVRVVRPWKQMMVRQDGPLWKRAAKAARNFLRAPGQLTDGSGWALERQPAEGLLQFLTACPTARVSGWRLLFEGRLAGSFVLSQVHGQTRLAAMDVEREEDWRDAVAMVTQAAAEMPDTCEVVADTTLPVFAQALAQCGYRECGSQPVYLKDPKGLLNGQPLHITASDCDAFFTWFPESHFAG